MCAITGLVHFNSEILTPQFERFTNSLQHRGPDGVGFWLSKDRRVALGHRRLAIIDTSSAGRQPMRSQSGRYILTFNGEIYNYLELRSQLQTLGCNFSTATDTEVVLQAYEYWGMDAFLKMNGMWAIAIYDSLERTTLLIRDRFGVKPLFYWNEIHNFCAFASETIAFASLGLKIRQVDPLKMQFAIQSPSQLESTGYTVFQNIYQVLPGHYLIIRQDGIGAQMRWWNTLDHLITPEEEYYDQVREFKELFLDATKLRLRADVPLGTALSGGLDSSSVYANVNSLLKSKNGKFSANPFTMCFPGTSVDEKAYAEQVLAFTQEAGNFVEASYPNLVDEIISTTRLFDSITATPINSVTGIYKAMREAGIVVSLDGHGMDELAYGYTDSIRQLLYLEKRGSARFMDLSNTLTYMYPEDYQDHVRQSLRSKPKASIKFRQFAASVKYKFVKRKQTDWLTGGARFLESLSPNTQYDFSAIESKKRIAFDDFHSVNMPYNLRDFDRAAMQYGVEIRMPFMDYRIATYLLSLPVSSLVNAGYTKRILRDATKEILPESIRLRTNKIGLGAPTADWFNGPLENFVLDSVHSQSFLESPIWNGRLIQEEATQLSKDKAWLGSKATRMWNILNAYIILENGGH